MNRLTFLKTICLTPVVTFFNIVTSCNSTQNIYGLYTHVDDILKNTDTKKYDIFRYGTNRSLKQLAEHHKCDTTKVIQKDNYVIVEYNLYTIMYTDDKNLIINRFVV